MKISAIALLSKVEALMTLVLWELGCDAGSAISCYA